MQFKKEKLILPGEKDTPLAPPSMKFKPKNVDNLISHQEQEAARTLTKAKQIMTDEEVVRVYQQENTILKNLRETKEMIK